MMDGPAGDSPVKPTVAEVLAQVARRDERATVSSTEVVRSARDERSGGCGVGGREDEAAQEGVGRPVG